MNSPIRVLRLVLYMDYELRKYIYLGIEGWISPNRTGCKIMARGKYSFKEIKDTSRSIPYSYGNRNLSLRVSIQETEETHALGIHFQKISGTQADGTPNYIGGFVIPVECKKELEDWLHKVKVPEVVATPSSLIGLAKAIKGLTQEQVDALRKML